MTTPDQPPPDKGPDGKGPDGKGPDGKGKSSAPAPVDLLSVVAFDRHNPITGTDHTVVGVVVAVDDQGLTVRPLAEHHHRVTRDEVSVVTAEDDEV